MKTRFNATRDLAENPATKTAARLRYEIDAMRRYLLGRPTSAPETLPYKDALIRRWKSLRTRYRTVRTRKANAGRCRCREPKTHAGCAYCGTYWGGGYVCGVCKENGVDGPVIRGTSRVVCRHHAPARV